MESATGKSQINRLAPELLTYAVAAVMCVVALFLVLRLWQADLHVPMGYISVDPLVTGGDEMWIYMLSKSLIDNGWVQHNPHLGMPVGMNLLDFPITENLHLLVMKAISLLTGDFAVTVNLYYLAGYVLAAMTMAAAARAAGLARPTAVALGLLYATLPGHFMRGEAHLFIGAYFLVPLCVMVCLWIAQDQPLVFPFGRTSNKGWIALLICVLSGIAYVYYAFFFGLFLITAGAFAALRARSGRKLIDPLILLAVLSISFLISVSPNLIYRIRNGPNPQAVERLPEDAEAYSLRIVQMILPIPNHRIAAMAALRQKYDDNFAFVNENTAAALGTIPTCGLLFLLWRVIRRLAGADGDPVLDALSMFAIIALLIATMGGFSVLISLLSLPLIRSYNRISVFIAVFSLLAFGIILERAAQRIWSKSSTRVALPIALIVMVVLGILDQSTPSLVPRYADMKADFESDRQFVQQIESVVPAGSMIYQLPDMPFPESPPVGKMTDYQLFRGYLHSSKLRWSYGAMKGREIAEWEKKIANPMADRKIAALRAEGFAGLYIDTMGYVDSHGNPDPSLALNLQNLLKTKPIVSPNGRLVFFKLTDGPNQ